MIRTFGRIAAAVALLLATVAVATVATNSTAGAANVSVTLSCPNSGMNVSSQMIGFNDTVTLTIGSGCLSAAFIGGQSGPTGSATLNGAPMTAGSYTSAAQGDTIVYTAPSSGVDQIYLMLSPNQGGSGGATAQVAVMYPVPTGSIANNGDGTAAVNYVGFVNFYLYASGTTCANPRTNTTGVLYGIYGNPNATVHFNGSPSTVTVGMSAWVPSSQSTTTIAAGVYQACLYAGPNLLDSVEVGIGAVVPTTTTTTTTAGTDPVIPAFTG